MDNSIKGPVGRDPRVIFYEPYKFTLKLHILALNFLSPSNPMKIRQKIMMILAKSKMAALSCLHNLVEAAD